MEKAAAVATLGAEAPGLDNLLRPTLHKAALAANDRLKLVLSTLQAAAAHAERPETAAIDLAREIAAAGIIDRAEADWLRELPQAATLAGDSLELPDLPRLAALLRDDLRRMARPVLAERGTDGRPDADGLAERVERWVGVLDRLPARAFPRASLDALTHGQRTRGDSLHLTVMDLHKALARQAAALATEQIGGAHCWQLAADGSDRPRIEAFMRGVASTRALKGDHPGLDTAATRDGARLLIQNDIGTNDVHVLVLQVACADAGATAPRTITLTYSDLHRQRFRFFQQLLADVGAHWGEAAERRSEGLNAGEAYHLGTARFVAADEAALATQLEAIGARIVFLIDWNRARKRLLAFVGKDDAVRVLTEGARRQVGHMAWLNAGAERLVWNAMAAQGAGVFRLGDRLDDVLGAEPARELLVDVLVLASRAAARGQPAALVEDEVRALLTRRLQHRRGEFELLQEHAALCHALAQALVEALTQRLEEQPAAAARLAARAQGWERQADQLVVRARALAERQPQWRSLAQLVERSDDVADPLEEACFVFSLAAEHFGALAEAAPDGTAGTDGPAAAGPGWGAAVREPLLALAQAVLEATEDHVRTLAVAATLGDGADAHDHDEFLAASWRVLQAERRCDDLLRAARRALAAACRARPDAVALSLGGDLAALLESASDALLALGYGVRTRAFHRIEAHTP